jgi:multiple sugar transport system substrate-binding protein
MEALSRTFACDRPDVAIEWAVRSLNDFEHQPIVDIAEQYDLLIIDHPFCGDIAQTRAFVPLDTAIPDLFGPDADRLYVGPSLPSYRYNNQAWAAPIDAATPHAAYRPDILNRLNEQVPENWSEAIALGRRLGRLGLWLGTPVVSPHSFATLASLMANLGRPLCPEPGNGACFDAPTMNTALDAVDELLALSPPAVLSWNAIALHEAMVARDDIAFTPSVYGYATYAEADMRAPLRFAGFCGLAAPYSNGSMLGGTGLGVSATSKHRKAALDFVRFCQTREAQDSIVPNHHGQPALVTSWEDAANDARFGGYYSSVRNSIEGAWVRPRFPGYVSFQAEVGRLVEAYCRRDLDRRSMLNRVAAAGRTYMHAM